MTAWFKQVYAVPPICSPLSFFWAYFCRWEQCRVSLSGWSCLHTELQDWLNRKLFRQKRAAACISYSGIDIRLLGLLVLWLFKQTVSLVSEEFIAWKWGIIQLVRAAANMNVTGIILIIIYLHSCSPPESWADSRMIEGDWRTRATRGCPAHRGGAVGVCRASSALTSCRLSFATPLRMTRAAPPPLLQALGKYWHTVWSNFT